MRVLIRNITLILAVLCLSVWSIIPPEKKLRLGRDLRGGVSLIYSVQIKPGDPSDVVSKVIEVIKERIDPKGLSEISIVQQGRDRIEITMPLPNAKVKQLKQDYETALAGLAGRTIDPAEFERVMRMTGPEREAAITRLAGSDPDRAAAFRNAAAANDTAGAARARLEQAQADLAAGRAANADEARIKELTAKVDEQVAAAADAELARDRERDRVLAQSIDPAEVRRAVEAAGEPRIIIDDRTGQRAQLDSPRQTKLAELEKRYPDQKAQLAAVVAAFDRFAAERTRLDDPADLRRMLAGAGVLDFRITVPPDGKPNSLIEEPRLRRELHERGPRNVQSTQARWYKINKIDGWFDSVQDLERLKADPASYFATYGGIGYVAEEYDGDYYLLCWDTPNSRLTRAEGDWAVSAAYPSTDQQRGTPAISFEMDPRGGSRLGQLTGAHVQEQMAVLLDDQVYTAPTLQSKITRQGQITGTFTDAEIRYIVRVLSAGSLQAKLSPQPISEMQLAPELGADNLSAGLLTGLIAFAVVAVFMIIYYFSSGAIGVLALGINFIMVLAIMSLNRAAFTLPGIAGIILTFGQAIDANVLVYERMREEFLRGADMRTAVRLGFSRAYSSIVDGNIANLLICVVLYYFGTQEIRGFAITLGIGVVTTLFTGVFISRNIFELLVEHVHWRKASQLPMAVPFVQRLLSPHVDWMRWRWWFLGALAAFLAVSAALWYQRGEKLLDTEFLGGTQVELQFKQDPQTGQPLKLKRQEVLDRVQAMGTQAEPGSPLKVLRDAEVIPIEAANDGVTSDRFKIKLGVTDGKTVLAALVHEFSDYVESQGALDFSSSAETDWRRAPVYRIVSKVLGENLDRPTLRDDVSGYVGGVAIVVEGIKPPASKESLSVRLEQMRQRPEYSGTLARKRELRILEGTDQAATAAVILVHDEAVSLFQNDDRWGLEVAASEWNLTRDALTHSTQLASVQTFSPTIAKTFKAQAIVSVVMSLLLLTIYVWVRFGTGRWAIAATLPLFADVIGIVGLIAVAQMLYDSPATNAFAARLGILPFKIDLNQIAALLTITGYSLNDKIIILDRIRENKGKVPYASYSVINESINQTLSRTFITAGTTLFSTVVLYLFAGEAVRGFAYTFTLGVFLGTYTSIVSSPLVWSRKADQGPTIPPRGQTQSSVQPPEPVGV